MIWAEITGIDRNDDNEAVHFNEDAILRSLSSNCPTRASHHRCLLMKPRHGVYCSLLRLSRSVNKTIYVSTTDARGWVNARKCYISSCAWKISKMKSVVTSFELVCEQTSFSEAVTSFLEITNQSGKHRERGNFPCRSFSYNYPDFSWGTFRLKLKMQSLNMKKFHRVRNG